MEKIRKRQRIESSKLKEKEIESQHYLKEIKKYKQDEIKMTDMRHALMQDELHEQQHKYMTTNRYEEAIEQESIIVQQFKLMKTRLKFKRQECKNIINSNCQILNQQAVNTRQYCCKIFQLSQNIFVPFYPTSSTNNYHSKKYRAS